MDSNRTDWKDDDDDDDWIELMMLVEGYVRFHYYSTYCDFTHSMMMFINAASHRII